LTKGNELIEVIKNSQFLSSSNQINPRTSKLHTHAIILLKQIFKTIKIHTNISFSFFRKVKKYYFPTVNGPKKIN